MNKRLAGHSRKMFVIGGLLLSMDATLLMGEPTPVAVSAFNSYTKAVESRLAQQHRSPNAFLAPATSDPTSAARRLRRGDEIIERLTPSAGATSPERCCTTGAVRPLLPELKPQTSSG
jgi:hypothetical protein